MKNLLNIGVDKSLRLRFTLSMVTVIVFIFLICSSAIIYQNAKTNRTQLDKRLTDASKLAEKSLPNAIWQYNYDFVNDFIESLFLYEDIIFVRVLSSNETIKEKINSDYPVKGFLFFKRSSHFSTIESSILFEGNKIGSIQIAATHKRIQKMILYSSVITILFMCMFIFSIILTVYIISKRYVFTPLGKLENSAAEIACGNWNVNIDTSGTDEIGSLSKTFDQMIKNLKATTASRVVLEQEIKERKKTEEQRDKIIVDLQKALTEIKTLRGILPICSHCKKIRDDKGYWNQIESYIHEHSEAEFSHGICQECAKKYYPDMDLYGEDEN